MQSIPIARIAHVLAYTHVLRRIGAPVDRELRRARLPTLLEETPDGYLPAVAALCFLDSISRSEGVVSELGLLVTEGGSFGRLNPQMKSAIRAAPTLLQRMLRFGEFVAVENTNLGMQIGLEGESARVSLSLQGMPQVPGMQFSEWLQLDTMIGVVRDTLGNHWSPEEITFVSSFRPPTGLYERHPNTVVRCGQPKTSITLPASLLSVGLATPGPAPLATEREVVQIGSKVQPVDFEQALKLALRPYLGEGYPAIGSMARAAGMSARTLQRRLTTSGSSYRALVREARIQMAQDLMSSEGANVLQAACSVGYADPSNFARAYREVMGSRPRRSRARRQGVGQVGGA